jgi:hypothetical protein
MFIRYCLALPRPAALSLQPPLLALDAHRVFTFAPKEVSAIFEFTTAFLEIVSIDSTKGEDL